MLVEHIAIQHRFTKQDGNRYKNENGDTMREDFFEQGIIHKIFNIWLPK
jgi:hypothetical protein